MKQLIVFIIAALITAGSLAGEVPGRGGSIQIGVLGGFYPLNEKTSHSETFGDYSAGYSPDRHTTYTFSHKSLYNMTNSDFWRSGISREALLLASGERLTLYYSAGASMNSGEFTRQLSVDGGLRLRYDIFSWLYADARAMNFFYSDSALTEIFAGMIFPRVFLKGLSFSMLYPVTIYTGYTPIQGTTTKGKIAVNIRYRLPL